MDHTERARYQFKVTTSSEGTPWIATDAVDDQLRCFKDGCIGFDLKAGTTAAEAERLAEILNERVTTLSYTFKS
jgi:hypothetical protein